MGAPPELMDPAPPLAKAAPSRPAGPRPWAYWPFRLIGIALTVLIFNQAVYAGQFLAGDFGALAQHRDNANYAGFALLAELVAAVLLRWPGRGPVWPALTCLGMFVVVGLQIGLGYARVLAVHVPLGVALITGTVVLLVWAWRPKPGERVPFSGRGGPAASR